MNKNILFLLLLSTNSLLTQRPPQMNLPPLTAGYGDIVVIKHIKSNTYLSAPGTAINFETKTYEIPTSAYWGIGYPPGIQLSPSGTLENESSLTLYRINNMNYLTPQFSNGRYSFSASQDFPTEETPTLQVHFTDKTMLEVDHKFYMTVSRKEGEETKQNILTVRNGALVAEDYDSEKIPEKAQWTIEVVRPRMLTYGDIVTIQHLNSKMQLWTSTKASPNNPDKFPAGATSDLTKQTQWRVLPSIVPASSTYMGRPLVDNSSTIVLENIKTGNFLTLNEDNLAVARSFQKDSPKNFQWVLKHKKAPNDYEQQVRSKIPFMLVNHQNRNALTIIDVEKEITQNEESFIQVSGEPATTNNESANLWRITTLHVSPLITTGSVIQLRHDATNKYLGIDNEESKKAALVEKSDANSRWIVLAQESKTLWDIQSTPHPNKKSIPNNSIVIFKHEKTGDLLYVSPDEENNLTVKEIDYTTLNDEQKKKEKLRSELAIRFSTNPIRHQKQVRIYHDPTKRFLSFDPTLSDKAVPTMKSSNARKRTYDDDTWTIELAGEKKEDKEETTEKDKSKSSTQLAAKNVLKYNDVVSIKHSQINLPLGAASYKFGDDNIYTGLFSSEEPSFITMWRIIDPLRSKTPNTVVQHDDVIALEHVSSNVQISVNPKEIPAGKLPTSYYQVLSQKSARIKQKSSLRPQVSLQIKFKDPTKPLKENGSFTLYNKNSNAYLFSTEFLKGPYDAQTLLAIKTEEPASTFTLSSLHTKEDVDIAAEEATKFYNHRRDLDDKLKNKVNYFRTQIYSAHKNKDSNALKKILQESLTIINDHYTTKNEAGEEIKMRITPFTPCSLHLFMVSSYAITFANKLTPEELKELKQQVDIVVNHDILGKTHAWSLKRSIDQRLAPLLEDSDTKVITREIVSMILTIPHLPTKIGILISLFNNTFDDNVAVFIAEKTEYLLAEIAESEIESNEQLLSQLSSFFNSDKIRSLLDKYKVNYKNIYEKVQKQKEISADQTSVEATKKAIIDIAQSIRTSLTSFSATSPISPKFKKQLEKLMLLIKQKGKLLSQDTLELVRDTFKMLISKIQNSRDQNAGFIRNDYTINIEPKLNKLLELKLTEKKFPTEITTMKNKATLEEKISYVREILAAYSETELKEVYHHCAYLIYRLILSMNLMNDKEKADYASIIEYAQEHNVLTKEDARFVKLQLLPAIK